MKRDTSTCSPEDHRYPFNHMCCNMCQPGYRVHKHCTQTPDDGICVPCSMGYFTSEWNGATQCLPINLCNKSHEHISVHARPDGTSDNTCACDPGFEYTASGELCIESPVKVFTQGIQVTPEPSFTPANPGSTLASGSTQTQVPWSPTNSGSSSNQSHASTITVLGITLGLVILTFIIICIIVCVCFRTKKWCFSQSNQSNARESREGTTEPLNTVSLDMTEVAGDAEMQEGDSGRYTSTPGMERATSQEPLQTAPSASTMSGNDDQMLNVSDEGECHGMTSLDQEVLRSLMTDFASDLPVQPTLDRMTEIFNREDVENITSFPTEHDKRRCLINTLVTKGPEAYTKFVSVLDDVCQHLAKAVKTSKEQRLKERAERSSCGDVSV
ncbi:tumor necrosis factor receptor superfamily member 5-like isoform X2 [Ptychodera flava]